MRALAIVVLLASQAAAAPRVVVAVDPLFVDDFFGGAVEVGVSRHVALAASAAHFTSSTDPTWHTGLQATISTLYFLEDDRFEGLFLEPGVIGRSEDNKETTRTFLGPELLVGVQHVFDDAPITVALAAGAALPLLTASSTHEMTPINGYVRLGWAF